jgi:hypothetical protein
MTARLVGPTTMLLVRLAYAGVPRDLGLRLLEHVPQLASRPSLAKEPHLHLYDTSQITDDFMERERASTREYSLVILTTTPLTFTEAGRPVIWEHGRRNFALRADGLLSIVCPVTDGGDIAGIGIFNAPPDETRAIMQADPAVRDGVLEFRVVPVRGFPGDCLPGEPRSVG